MCDLIQITVTLIHPADDHEREGAAEIGIKGVLSIVSGTGDIPAEQDITSHDLIAAIIEALPAIHAGIDREWSTEWAVRREHKARQN